MDAKNPLMNELTNALGNPRTYNPTVPMSSPDVKMATLSFTESFIVFY